MRPITTRQVEAIDELSAVHALRYDYFVVARELDMVADHALCRLVAARDETALQFATYAGDDLVGCFRVEIGAPENLKFGADWALSDFLEIMPAQIALVGGFCQRRHVRDPRVIAHMVRQSVAIAKELELAQAFFEMPPALWPLFHEAGLTRKGTTLPDRETGLQTAVYQLDRRARVRFPPADGWACSTGEGLDDMDDAQRRGSEVEAMRPRLKIVAGGRG
jgi:hypothetical protein